MQQLGYIRQIDGIRAIAVMMVVVFHWFAGGMVTQSGMGLMGVDMFFALSGFLITRILLVYKWNQENGIDPHGRLHLVGRFMYRRALRIFPAYFVLLIILYNVSYFLPNTLKTDWGWYVTYLQNFLFYIKQSWAIGKLSPFWTLAVEEQFYLFWPLVILFVPAKRIGLAIGILFAVGFMAYHFLPVWLPKKLLVDILTPTCLHAFGAGAALAWIHLNKPEWLGRSNIFLVAGLSLVLISLSGRLYGMALVIDHRSLVAIGTACLIAYLLGNSEAFFGRYVLGNPLLVGIGKISYGIYLYHNFIPGYLKGIRGWLVKLHPDSGMLPFIPDSGKGVFQFYAVCFALLFLIAFCSFKFFEQPLLALKNKIS